MTKSKLLKKSKDWPAWLGVDLDGTLALAQDPFDPLTIGAPIPSMVAKVQKVLAGGLTVRILTARMADETLADKIQQVIGNWTENHVGTRLVATCRKDPGMLEIWDDKARRVESKTASVQPATNLPQLIKSIEKWPKKDMGYEMAHEALTDEDYPERYVVERDGEVAAAASISESEGCIYIAAMGVRDDMQGQGVGTEMLNFIKAKADQLGYEVRLRGWDENRNFYLKQGFEEQEAEVEDSDPVFIRPAQKTAAWTPDGPRGALGFRQDNPAVRYPGDAEAGLSWLASHPRTTTGWYESIMVAPSELVKLPGARNEHLAPNQEIVDKLTESMKTEGFRPADRPLVVVEADGQPKIYEGNHRVRAAFAAGIPSIPVTVRYFGGSEEIPGVWDPATLAIPKAASAITPVSLGRAVRKFCRSEESYTILDSTPAAGGTWTSGGCWLLAAAVARGFGGKVYCMMSRGILYDDPAVTDKLKVRPQHFVAKVGSLYIDADGASTEATLIRRWTEVEHLIDPSLEPYTNQTTGEIPAPGAEGQQIIEGIKGFLQVTDKTSVLFPSPGSKIGVSFLQSDGPHHHAGPDKILTWQEYVDWAADGHVDRLVAELHDDSYADPHDPKYSLMLEKKYNKAVRWLTSLSFPIEVYRVIRVERLDQVRWDDIGNSWSIDIRKAQNVYGLHSRGDDYLIKGTVNFDAVDIQTTLYWAMSSLHKDEKELRIKDRAAVSNVSIRKKKGGVWLPVEKLVTANAPFTQYKEAKPWLSYEEYSKKKDTSTKTADHTDSNGFWAGDGGGASGVLPICSTTKRICLAWRSEEVHMGDCWGTIGGAIQRGMSPQDSAKAEMEEETGYHGGVELHPAYVFSKGGFRYFNFIGAVGSEFSFNPGEDHGWETDFIEWKTLDEVKEEMQSDPGNFHPGMIALFKESAELIERLAGGDESAPESKKDGKAKLLQPKRSSQEDQPTPPSHLKLLSEELTKTAATYMHDEESDEEDGDILDYGEPDAPPVHALLYHGTDEPGLKKLRPGGDKLIWFSNDPSWAQNWGGLVVEAEVRIDRPFLEVDAGYHPEWINSRKDIARVHTKHDGIMFTNSGNDLITYAVYSPDQVTVKGYRAPDPPNKKPAKKRKAQLPQTLKVFSPKQVKVVMPKQARASNGDDYRNNALFLAEKHRYIYHGTSSKNVDTLKTQGVSEGRSFYASLSESVAWEEAMYTVTGLSKSKRAGGRPVVVVFDLKKFDADWYEDIEYQGDDLTPHAYWTQDGIPASAIANVLERGNGIPLKAKLLHPKRAAAAASIQSLEKVLSMPGSPGIYEMINWGQAEQVGEQIAADRGIDFSTLTIEEQDALIDPWVKAQLQKRYDDILRCYQQPSLTVYRALDLDGGIEQVEAEFEGALHSDKGFGTCWSWSESGADTYCSEISGGGTKLVFRGHVEHSAVDWETSFLNNVVNDEEKEIRLKRGAKVVIDGWRGDGETAWQAPPERLKSVTASLTTADKVKITDTPAFQSWFSGSKVVTPTGKPLIVYHGTEASFTEFTIGDIGFHVGTRRQANKRQNGDDKRIHSEGGDWKLMPLYASIKNPLRTNDAGNWHLAWDCFFTVNVALGGKLDFLEEFIRGEMKARGKTLFSQVEGLSQREISNLNRDLNRKSIDRIREEVIKLGYDGIVYKNNHEGGGDSWIAFKSTQLKSAAENNGSFDPENMSITAAKIAMPDFGYSKFNDREKALAKVKFVSEHDEGSGQLGVAARYGGTSVGHAYAVIEDGIAEISETEINAEWRGTGLGQRLYDKLIQAAKSAGCVSLFSDKTLTPEAHSAWNRLKGRYKVQEVENPDSQGADDEFESPTYYAMPDFGYSKFNDRDAEMNDLDFHIVEPNDWTFYSCAFLPGVWNEAEENFEDAVGYVDCWINVENEAIVADSLIGDKWRGTGLGQKLYDNAIAEAKRRGAVSFNSGSVLSPDAVNAWRRLSKRYLVKEVPGTEEGTDTMFTMDLQGVQPKAASPDFGYSKFNDRDEDLESIDFTTYVTRRPRGSFLINAGPKGKMRVAYIQCDRYDGKTGQAIPVHKEELQFNWVDYSDWNSYCVRVIKIDPEWRGTGLGQRLYDEAISKARSLGAQFFFSDIDRSSDAESAWKRLSQRYNVTQEHGRYCVALSTQAKAASPDFGYSKFNDRENDIEDMRYSISTHGATGYTVGARLPSMKRGEEAGFLFAYTIDQDAFVGESQIEEDWRGTGLGQILYDKAMQEAQKRGCTRFMSDVPKQRKPDADAAWKRLSKRHDVSTDPETGRYVIDIAVPLTKSASPDFGYSQFNDRDAEIDNLVWKTYPMGPRVTQISVYPAGTKNIKPGRYADSTDWIASIAFAGAKEGKPYVYVVDAGFRDEEDTQWRGTGLGQKLYDKAIAEAKKQGMERFYAGAWTTPYAKRAWDRLAKRYPVSVDEETRGKTPYVDLTQVGKTAAYGGSSALAAIVARFETLGASIDITEEDRFITLSSIRIPKGSRKQGIGTRFMEDLIAYADSVSKPVFLTASKDFGATSVARLQKFYGRFGFKKNTGRNKDFMSREGMVRQPKKAMLLTASPDYGYSQFNDRDTEVDNLIWGTTSFQPGEIVISAREPHAPPSHYAGSIYLDSLGENTYMIGSVGIRPAWRGTGLGQLLYDKAIEECKKKGGVTLYSDKDITDDAVKAWERLRQRYPVKKIRATGGKVTKGFRYQMDLRQPKKAKLLTDKKANLQNPSDAEIDALKQMESRSGSDFKVWLEDYIGADPDPSFDEVWADDSLRLDYFDDWLKDEKGIDVQADGSVMFYHLTPKAERIIGDLPVLLYHHTSSHLLPKIKKEGLRADVRKSSPHQNSGSGVYLTTEPSGPAVQGYINGATSRSKNGTGVSLLVKTYLRDLFPDPDDADISSGKHQFILPYVPPGDIMFPKRDKASPRKRVVEDTRLRSGYSWGPDMDFADLQAGDGLMIDDASADVVAVSPNGTITVKDSTDGSTEEYRPSDLRNSRVLVGRNKVVHKLQGTKAIADPKKAKLLTAALEAEDFEQGNCHAFALALHNTLGFKIQAVIDAAHGFLIHAYGVRPDGTLVDVTGTIDLDNAMYDHGDCDDPEVADMTPAEVMEQAKPRKWGAITPADLSDAEAIIRDNLELYRDGVVKKAKLLTASPVYEGIDLIRSNSSDLPTLAELLAEIPAYDRKTRSHRELRGIYQHTVDLHDSPGPISIYRAMALADGPESFRPESFGEFWSWDEAGAKAYYPEHAGAPVYVFQGSVAVQDVDWWETAKRELCNEEKEVRVIAGAKITLEGWKEAGASEWEYLSSGPVKVTAKLLTADKIAAMTVTAYHGTTSGEFDEFKPRYRKGEQLGFGIHFARDKEFAERYASDPDVRRKGNKPCLYTVTLTMHKPLRANQLVLQGSPEYDLALKLYPRVYTDKNENGVRCAWMQSAIDAGSPQRAERILRENGYDGVIYAGEIALHGFHGKVVTGKSECYVVLDPSQVTIVSKDILDEEPKKAKPLTAGLSKNPPGKPDTVYPEDSNGWALLPDQRGDNVAPSIEQLMPEAMKTAGRRKTDPPQPGDVLYHVAPRSWKPGYDLLSFEALQQEGRSPKWKWEFEADHSASVVSFVTSLEEAIRFKREFLPSGKVLKVIIPEGASSLNELHPDVNIEGYKTLSRVPSEWIQQVPASDIAEVLQEIGPAKPYVVPGYDPSKQEQINAIVADFLKEYAPLEKALAENHDNREVRARINDEIDALCDRREKAIRAIRDGKLMSEESKTAAMSELPSAPYDPSKPLYLRIGDWNPAYPVSTNNVSGGYEAGLSVYDTDADRNPVAPDGEWAEEDLRDRLKSGEPQYLVQGDLVGEGHDGEPLLGDPVVVNIA